MRKLKILTSFFIIGALRIHIRVAHIKFQDQNKRQINIANYLRTQKSLMGAKTENQLDQCMIKTEMLSLQEPLSPTASVPSSPLSYIAQSPQNNNIACETSVKSPKVFQCDECKKTFTTKYFLKKHKRLHTGKHPAYHEMLAAFFLTLFFNHKTNKERCHIHANNVEKASSFNSPITSI